MPWGAGDRSFRRSVGTSLALVLAAALVLGSAACSTAPIEGSAPSSVATAKLRSGPQTATVPGGDVVPVTTTPRVSLPATAESIGRGQVQVTDIDRILAIDRNGTLANIVFSLGLGPRVVGRDRSTVFPAAAGLPLVTSTGHTLNAEAVLALRPTVVLIDQSTTPRGAIDQIRASGVPVVEYTSVRTLAGTPDLIRGVAAALGVREAGDDLVRRTQSEIDEAKTLVPRPSGDPTMAFLYLRGRLQLIAGPGSGADDLIAALGGRDAGAAAGMTGAFTAITSEALLRANPDVVLVMTQGAESVGGLDGVLAIPGIAETSAGRARRVVQMDESEILAFGPDTGKVLAALARAIYT